MTDREIAARALCLNLSDEDPDNTATGKPEWTYYADAADAAIAVLFPRWKERAAKVAIETPIKSHGPLGHARDIAGNIRAMEVGGMTIIDKIAAARAALGGGNA